jgi:hypothetical protein
VDEALEEAEAERQSKAKVEKQRHDLQRDLDQLNEKLEEAGEMSSTQIEANKKRDAEVAKYKRDLDEANLNHEATITQLKKKQQETIAELTETIEQLQKGKGK